MSDARASRAIKEALAKYGLDRVSPVELAATIMGEWGVEVTPADIVAVRARLRRGLEKPRSEYPGATEPDNGP